MIRNSLSERYHKLMRMSKTTSHKTHASLDSIGLYRGQPPLLFLLWEQDGQSKSELGAALGVTSATITKMVSRLQKNEFIETKADANDLRVSRVYLTEKGKKIEGSVRSVFKDLNKYTFQGFSDEELKNLDNYIDRIIFNIMNMPIVEDKGGTKID